MKPEIGKNYRITTQGWFVGPDGRHYKGVWGTVNAILTDAESLGIRTNSRSTNWYLSIGCMVIAGCQVFYAIQTDSVFFGPTEEESIFEGKVNNNVIRSKIYNANENN